MMPEKQYCFIFLKTLSLNVLEGIFNFGSKKGNIS